MSSLSKWITIISLILAIIFMIIMIYQFFFVEDKDETENEKEPSIWRTISLMGFIIFLLLGIGGGFFWYKSTSGVNELESESELESELE